MSSADDSFSRWGAVETAAVAAAIAFVVLNGLIVHALKLGFDEVLLLAFASAFVLGWRVPALGIVGAVGLTFALWLATGAYFGTGGEIDVRPVPFALTLLGFALVVRSGFWLVRRFASR